MSCIRFTTKAQLAAIRDDAAALAAGDQAILHLSPPVTESKIARLRLLAAHDRAGIRRSVASNLHAPQDLLQALAADPDPGVRGEVAKNETTDPTLVEALSRDRDARVRCWAVLNPVLSEQAVGELALERLLDFPGVLGASIKLCDPDGRLRLIAARDFEGGAESAAGAALATACCECERKMMDGRSSWPRSLSQGRGTLRQDREKKAPAYCGTVLPNRAKRVRSAVGSSRDGAEPVS